MSCCGSTGDIEDFGFNRKEMFSQELAGSIEKYDGHIFLCVSTTYTDWPQDANSFSPVKQLSTAVKAAQKAQGLVIKVTVCEGEDRENGDVIFFPPKGSELKEPCRFKEAAATTSSIEWFIGCIFSNSSPSCEKIVPIGKDFIQVFVCCHVNRDKRCGKCGPELLHCFRALSSERLPVSARACSHVGGHVYAGNVIVYRGGDLEWFGYVTPAAAPPLLSWAADCSAAAPPPLPDAVAPPAAGVLPPAGLAGLWRGRMGLAAAQHRALAAAAGVPLAAPQAAGGE